MRRGCRKPFHRSRRESAAESILMQAHVGCSGWFYWHWRGIFYPRSGGTENWFRHYTAHFSTVELNAPFYSWPKPGTVKGWLRSAPDNFRYSIKVNREITHERRLVRTKQ